MTNERKTIRRKLIGTVVSDRMTKTRVVVIVRFKKHPKYLKYYKVTRRFKAHDEANEYRAGDKVRIEETRPLSKEKRWSIVGRVEERKSPLSTPS